MRPGVPLKPTLRLLSPAIFLLLGITTGHADPVTGTWTQAQGSAVLSNTGTSSPTWGNGTTDNAAASAIYSAFSTVTLANTGDRLTMTGSADLLGITSGVLAFRFGLFNVNGSANANGWLGYFVGNATASNGVLDARNSPNSALFTSTTGVTQLAAAAATGGTSFTTAANPVTYTFSFTIERTSTSTLLISTSLFRPSDSAEFAGYSNVSDASPYIFSFDRVGFQATGALAADQIQLHNIDVAYTTAVPEPATYAPILSALCFLAVAARRRLSV